MSRHVRVPRHDQMSPVPSVKAFLQSSAAQVRYTKGGSMWKWYSHGFYIGRQSKRRDEEGRSLGFDFSGEAVPLAATLAGWRKDKDDMFFRVMLSPEHGDRMDLTAYTREVMAGVVRTLGTRLEWVAVCHHNTDQPHVHVVIRGLREDGSALSEL